MKTAYEIGEAMCHAKQHPMSDEVTKHFVLISLLENAKAGVGDEFKATFNYRLFEARAEHCNFKVNEYVIGFLCGLCDRPGTAVLYCAALYYIFVETGKEVDMESLSQFFPMGFPDETSLHEIWKSQKVPFDKTADESRRSDNSLDFPQAWPKAA